MHNTSSLVENEAFLLEVAKRLGQLLTDTGIPTHQQVHLLTQICGLSPSQARRKLQGANWSFPEVLAVARHCNVSLDALFPESPSSQQGTQDLISAQPSTTWLDVTIAIGNFSGRGKARLGTMVTGQLDVNTLLACQTPEGWCVSPPQDLPEQNSPTNVFVVDELLIRSQKSNLHQIAVIDDDQALAESLAEWFSGAGFQATAFTSEKQLLSESLANFDGFIVDYLLDGQPSQEIINKIRQQLPDAPILLLTGKLRDSQVSEAELMAVLRTSHVTFFEKPVRPGVLAAALLNSFDRLETKRA